MIQVVNCYLMAGGFAGSTITIPSGKTASNLTNYPVYLNLADMPAAFWSNVNADGGNIRVKQSGSVIPFDMVVIDTSAHTGTLFFKASTLSAASDNVFTIDLSGSGLLATNDTNGRNACWSAFDFVCLLESTTTSVDRTGNGSTTYNNNAGSTPTQVAFGTVAKCAGLATHFTGTNTADNISFSGRTSRSIFTLGITQSPQAAPVSANGIAMAYLINSTTRLGFGVRDFSSPDHYSSWDNADSWNGSTSSTIAANTPTRLHDQYNGTTQRKLYVNGALASTDNTITGRSADTIYVIGASTTGGNEGAGSDVGYAYARPEYLSADYIAAEYSNLNAPSSFYTIT